VGSIELNLQSLLLPYSKAKVAALVADLLDPMLVDVSPDRWAEPSAFGLSRPCPTLVATNHAGVEGTIGGSNEDTTQIVSLRQKALGDVGHVSAARVRCR
jgi:hypothetical protein